ncbi:MAG: diphthamide biosynthesis enzyme Dph2 [Candidatus Bathyarchaeota archaeon]|nr:diphthamide biosynthesis enzyme Dph2 [Candidatus Bathyarchaeota archaeon]
MYDLELERVVSEIKERKANKVLLQLPDGMRPFAYQLVDAIEKSTDATVFLSGDSCYGACDIALSQAKQLDADLIVHYGHTPMVKHPEMPVIYVHASIDVDVDKLVEEVLPSLREYKAIGLTTTVQHTHQVEEIKAKLMEKGVKVLLGKGTGKTPLDGQILGCSYMTAINIMDKVDAYLYVGGGRFHPTGIVMSTGKPVIVANPYNGQVSSINEDDLMDVAKRRVAAVTVAKNAKRFGILVSSKPGQNNFEKAVMLQKGLREQGKEAVIIYMDEIRADHVNNYSEPEILVNTACPRIAIDGIDGIDRPMLTINETEVVLGVRSWESLWGNSYME